MDFFHQKSKRPKTSGTTFPSAKIKELSNQDHLSSKISFKNEGQGFPDSSVVMNPLANAGRHGLDLWSGEDPTCLGATKSVGHSYWAQALESKSCNYLAHMPQLAKPTGPRVHAQQQEKLPQWEACGPQLESSSHLPQWEKSPHSNEDPAQS